MNVFRDKKILVVVAHPDDELLGLGATMYSLIKEENCQVRAIILGEGITSRADVRDTQQWDKELAEHRRNIDTARHHIGYQSIGVYDFPDNRFDSVDLLDLVKVIEQEKQEFAPEVIFTHHGNDLNIDHQRTFQAVMTATRPMAHEKVQTVLTFETPSSTEWQAGREANVFRPNFFFSISEEALQAKIKGMEAYTYESRPFPHPRSPEALRILAQQRGVETGTALAEAFELIRWRYFR